MKLLIAPLLLLSTAATAQTLEQRADKIITAANFAENAMQRVMAEAKRLKADITAGTPPVAPPLVVAPPVDEPPHHGSLLPYIDNSKIPAPATAFSAARIREGYPHEAGPSPTADGSGAFRTTCDFSHMNYDDPIVYPGKKGASHLHVFFGNVGINYASTRTGVETTGKSTCAGELQTAPAIGFRP